MSIVLGRFVRRTNFLHLIFYLVPGLEKGVGFGNDSSTITANYQMVMNGTYVEVKHRSVFEPTSEKPQGEAHTDRGFISYDNTRKIYVFRQFNIEGYINQYILVDSLSSDSKLVFETEIIENFPPKGKARWAVIKKSDDEIETFFDVSFPGKDYLCFGTNFLHKVN